MHLVLAFRQTKYMMVSNNSADLFPQRSQSKKCVILLSKATLLEGKISIKFNKNATHSSLL